MADNGLPANHGRQSPRAAVCGWFRVCPFAQGVDGSDELVPRELRLTAQNNWVGGKNDFLEGPSTVDPICVQKVVYVAARPYASNLL